MCTLCTHSQLDIGTECTRSQFYMCTQCTHNLTLKLIRLLFFFKYENFLLSKINSYIFKERNENSTNTSTQALLNTPFLKYLSCNKTFFIL